jgi:hypothetical protein
MNWYKKAQDEEEAEADKLMGESFEEFLVDNNVPTRKKVIMDIKDKIGKQTGIQITDQWWNTYVDKYFRSVAPRLEDSPAYGDMQNVIDKIVEATEICKTIRNWNRMEELLNMEWDLFIAIVGLVKMGPVSNVDDLEAVIEAYQELSLKNENFKAMSSYEKENAITSLMSEKDNDPRDAVY